MPICTDDLLVQKLNDIKEEDLDVTKHAASNISAILSPANTVLLEYEGAKHPLPMTAEQWSRYNVDIDPDTDDDEAEKEPIHDYVERLMNQPSSHDSDDDDEVGDEEGMQPPLLSEARANALGEEDVDEGRLVQLPPRLATNSQEKMPAPPPSYFFDDEEFVDMGAKEYLSQIQDAPLLTGVGGGAAESEDTIIGEPDNPEGDLETLLDPASSGYETTYTTSKVVVCKCVLA